MKTLGDLRMQSSDFAAAIRIYSDIITTETGLALDPGALSSLSSPEVEGLPWISHNTYLTGETGNRDSSDAPYLGDVFHALGAAWLDRGSGGWRMGHGVWRQGLRFAPSHAALKEAVHKLDAYYSYSSSNPHSSSTPLLMSGSC